MGIKHAYTQIVADGTATSVVRPSDWNSNHVVNYQLSGNTLGSSQIAGQDVLLVGGNNLTLSADTAASKLIFSAGGAQASIWEPYPPLGGNSAFSTLGLNSIYLQKINPQVGVVFNQIERRCSISSTSSSNSQSAGYTFDYGLYSRMTGASSLSWGLVGSSQLFISASFNSSTTQGLTMSAGTQNWNTGSNTLAFITGMKQMYLPFASSMSGGGQYAFAMRMSSATAVNTAAFRIGFLDLSVMNNLTNGRFGLAGASMLSSNASYVDDFGQMVYTTTSNGLPATIADSGFTNVVSRQRMYLQFDQ